MNKVIIIGRLGADVELRYTQAGAPVANFSVATDESYTDQQGNKVEKTEWHRIIVFQRQAENCAQYIGKGSLVCVEGSIQTRQWQDQNGQQRYTTEIKAQRVQFLSTRSDGQQQQPQQGAQPQQNTRQAPAQQRQQAPAPGGGFNGPANNTAPAFPSEVGGMDDVPFSSEV
jgi:single-strand DNA-binding protein